MKYTIQIEASLTASARISADSLEEALSIAQKVDVHEVIKTKGGWTEEWDDGAAVQGVYL